MSTSGSPPIDSPTAVATIELTRAEVEPHDAPGLTWPLRGLMGFVALIGFVQIVAGRPGDWPAEGWMLLLVSAVGLVSSGPLGRLWARARLRRRAEGVAKSPHRWPGIWYETPRRRALGYLIVSGLLLVALARAGDETQSSRGRRRSRSEALETPRDRLRHAIVRTVVGGSIAALCGIVGALSALTHWRFGASRLVPSRPDLEEGEVLSAVLEASPRLARAREVVFELLEQDVSSSSPSDLLLGRPGVVWAKHAVPSDAFGAVPGLTLVPMTLQVPIEAHTACEDGWFGVHAWPPGYVWFDRGRLKTQAWEVRARAEVDGIRYDARFRVKTISRRDERPSERAIREMRAKGSSGR